LYDNHKLGIMFQAYTNNLTCYTDRPFIIDKAQQYKYLEHVAFYGLTWADLSSIKFGFALFNKRTMGYRRANRSDTLFMVLAQSGRVPMWGDVILNGNYTYEYALYPHIGDWKTGDVHREANNYNFKALTYVGDPSKGTLPQRLSLLESSVKNVLVSAVYTKKGKLYVRMYEYIGESASVNLLSQISH